MIQISIQSTFNTWILYKIDFCNINTNPDIFRILYKSGNI